MLETGAPLRQGLYAHFPEQATGPTTAGLDPQFVQAKQIRVAVSTGRISHFIEHVNHVLKLARKFGKYFDECAASGSSPHMD
jgi:hypothetical protein